MGIKNFDTFKKIEPIKKGWSSDKKYFIETLNNEKLLTIYWYTTYKINRLI